MQAFTLFAAATAIAVAATDDWGLNAPTLLALAGVLGVATQAVLSRFWVVPMSDEMIAWSESGVPADSERFLRLWTVLQAGPARSRRSSVTSSRPCSADWAGGAL